MKTKCAIITGITSQDGAYLAQLLLNRNYNVVGLTRSYHSANLEKLRYLGILSQIEVVQCDLLDISSIYRMVENHHPDEVYNLAAQSSVGTSFDQPIGTIHFNILSVVNLLETIRTFDFGIKLYQASSSEMFGRLSKLPITEYELFHPLSPYGVSKASAHWSVVNYRESYGLYACCGILFNHESYLRSPNFFVKKVVSTSVRIANGSDEKLIVGNIDVKRDFGYSPFYVEAIWRILQQDQPDDYLICSGHSVVLREIINYTFQKLGISIERLQEDHRLYRPNDIPDIYGDPSKAERVLGWEYDLSFEQLMDRLIEEEIQNYEDF